jgi:hypothetical protein
MMCTGAHMENVLHTRIVHDESRARYIALIEFNSQARWAPTHRDPAS